MICVVVHIKFGSENGLLEGELEVTPPHETMFYPQALVMFATGCKRKGEQYLNNNKAMFILPNGFLCHKSNFFVEQVIL